MSDEHAWVRILSEDGFTFVARESVVKGAGTWKDALESGFSERDQGLIEAPFGASTVEKVLEYLAYKETYKDATERDEYPDFYERIPVEMVLELLVASDYLQC